MAGQIILPLDILAKMHLFGCLKEIECFCPPSQWSFLLKNVKDWPLCLSWKWLWKAVVIDFPTHDWFKSSLKVFRRKISFIFLNQFLFKNEDIFDKELPNYNCKTNKIIRSICFAACSRAKTKKYVLTNSAFTTWTTIYIQFDLFSAFQDVPTHIKRVTIEMRHFPKRWQDDSAFWQHTTFASLSPFVWVFVSVILLGRKKAFPFFCSRLATILPRLNSLISSSMPTLNSLTF